MRTVVGSVEKTKEVQTRDGKHFVVAILRDNQTQSNRRNAPTRPSTDNLGANRDQYLAVDLGNVSGVSHLNILQGQQISVKGVTTKVGDQTVLLARSFSYEGQRHQVQWQSRQLSGKVLSTHTANVRGRLTSFGMVQLDNDKGKVAVDFGPIDRPQPQIETGDQITFSGVPINAEERRLVLAQQIQRDGLHVRIDRSRNPAGSSSRNNGTSDSAPVIHGRDVNNADD